MTGWIGAGFLQFFPLSGMLALTEFLFLYEARSIKRLRQEGVWPDHRWWKRSLHYILGVGVPLITLIGVTISYPPLLIQGIDDGDRSARRIIGNGVTLIWAPEGPGWNWKQDWGGYPSYNSLAFYGIDPIGLKNQEDLGKDVFATMVDLNSTGLCNDLNEDGIQIMGEPQNI